MASSHGLSRILGLPSCQLHHYHPDCWGRLRRSTTPCTEEFTLGNCDPGSLNTQELLCSQTLTAEGHIFLSHRYEIVPGVCPFADMGFADCFDICLLLGPTQAVSITTHHWFPRKQSSSGPCLYCCGFLTVGCHILVHQTITLVDGNYYFL